MKAKNKISAILATLVLIVSVFMVIPLPVSADDTVVVLPLWVESSLPYLVHIYGLPGNDTGAVNYMLLTINSTDRSENLTSWEIDVSYNPKVLKFLSAKEGIPGQYGGFLNRTIPGDPATTAYLRSVGGGGNTTFNPGTLTVDPAGLGMKIVGINCTQVSPSTPSTFLPEALCPLPSSLDVLAMVIFMTIDYGKSPILLDGSYVDSNGLEHVYPDIVFPKSVPPGYDGYYALIRHTARITGPYERYLIWREPPHSIGENFTMPLTIITSEEVHSWTASISFDRSVIKCLSVTEGTFLSSVNATTWTPPTIEDGTVTGFGSDLDYALSYATGHGTLATPMFEVVDYGKTDITITACSTLNVTGGEIITPVGPVVKEDGYFEFEKLLTIAFDPPSVDWTLTGKTPGETFTVDLTISTTEHVHSWKAGFRFNPLVLNCTNVTQGPWLATGGTTTFDFVPEMINNTKGEVTSFNCTLVTSGAYATGPGVLATIEFKVIDYGETDVELTYVIGDPCETKLANPAYEKIPIDKLVDGRFEFRSGVSVSLPYISSWAWGTGEWFTVELKINTLEKVSSWSAGFRFNASVLQCNSVTEGTWLATGGTTEWLPGTINNTIGEVTAYGCALKGEGLYATGSGVLAILNFTVVGSGWSIIELTDLDLDPCEALVHDRGWPGVHPPDECDLLYIVDGLKFMGDADGDRFVGGLDLLYKLCPAFGTKPGDPNWNPNADFDGDWFVGGLDMLYKLCPNFGQKY